MDVLEDLDYSQQPERRQEILHNLTQRKLCICERLTSLTKSESLISFFNWLNPIIVDEPLGLQSEQHFSAKKTMKGIKLCSLFSLGPF